MQLHPLTKNRTGEQYGRLIVLSYSHSVPERGPYWLCRCDCGKEIIVCGRELRSGHTRSCGCLLREYELAGGPHKTHGMGHTVENNIWRGIRNRCYNPRSHIYKHYGGRGIFMCDRWQRFENFYTDMGPRPSPEHSIERINNDGPYSPENCRWATKDEQMNNTRSNHLVTFNGATHTIADWGRLTGIRKSTLSRRLCAGWSVERALTTPLDLSKRHR